MLHDLTDDYKLNEFGIALFRIRATRDIPIHGVRAGDIGGWVDAPERVTEDAWLADDAEAFNHSVISGSALVSGNSQVFDSATVSDFARVSDNAKVHSFACVSHNAVASGNAEISNGTFLLDQARVHNVTINCGAWIDANADILAAAHFFFSTPPLFQVTRQNSDAYLVNYEDWSGTLAEFNDHPEAHLFSALLRSRIDAP